MKGESANKENLHVYIEESILNAAAMTITAVIRIQTEIHCLRYEAEKILKNSRKFILVKPFLNEKDNFNIFFF